MQVYFIKRIINAVVVLWLVTSITFCLMHAIPGGPFTANKNLPPQVKANIEARYKLNDPLFIQYKDYMTNLLHGDLGPSFKYQGRTVNDIIVENVPASFELGFEAVLFCLIFGVPLGMWAAIKQGRWQDKLVGFLTTIGISVPSFVMAALLIKTFAMELDLLPVALWYDWSSRVLPVVTLSVMPMAFVAKLTRSSMLEVLGQEYIKTARAKGLSEFRIMLRHALPNAIMPVVTYIGPMTAGVLTGSFVIENIFAIPGLGKFFITSIYNRDYTVILGITVFYSAIVILLNMLVDLVYPLLDPRIKLGKEGDA